MSKLFSVLGILFASGGLYFFFKLTNSPNIGKVIVLPIYIGIATGGAVLFFSAALIAYFFKRIK